MNIPDIMSVSPGVMPNVPSGIQAPSGAAITPEEKAISVSRKPVEDRLRMDDAQFWIDHIRSDFVKQITGDSLDETFAKALDLYKSIANSADGEETKKLKTELLDEAVKIAAESQAGKLTQMVYIAGNYTRAPDKEEGGFEGGESDAALRLLLEGQVRNAREDPFAFLDPVEAQELANDADIAELVNPEAEEGLLDQEALEASGLSALLERQAESLSERKESRLSKEIKALERKNESEYREEENRAFLAAYQSDPEKAAELQPDNVGIEMASFAMAQGIINSAKRLALDFIGFVRANPEGSYEELAAHLNRNSGKRDLNRLSLADFGELGGKIAAIPKSDPKKDPNSSAKALAGLLDWYSDTIYNKRMDDALDRLWRQKSASSGIYDKNGKISREFVDKGMYYWKFP